MIEQWKDIKSYEGKYAISNYGNVKILTCKRKAYIGKYLKYCNDKDGYALVNLYKNGKQKSQKVHKLVALHFILNLKNKPIINHKDGNKWNNHINNLEWCTYSENNFHAYKNGLMKGMKGENHPNAILKESDVKIIRSSKLDNKTLSTIFNISEKYIYNIKNNLRWSHVL